jgi:aspartyl-tRNA(Asn)/glutamyl-tRNA(Gln) amidotransferase subunit B
MNFEKDIIIGLECHVELKTNTKLFCSCKREADENEEPNSRVCPICLGHPGTRPSLNKKAFEMALKLCLALNCNIADELIFSRKSYFYPDLSKNYQISQFEEPLGENGKLTLSTGEKIGIERIHLEEDPASLVHPENIQTSNFTYIDYNRSGNPLCEIVTKPEIDSPAEAREFMKELITILKYLEVYDVNSCVIKADANVSIKSSGYVRSEIKNVTGFKEIEKALNYEIKRQKEIVSNGGKLVLETRGWDSEKCETYSMRVKETSEDYGYIIEPDIVNVEVTDEIIENIKKHMPQLANDKVNNYVKNFNLAEDDAKVIAQEKKLAELFEKVAEEINPILAAKWLRRELVRVLNYNKKTIEEIELDEKYIIELLSLIEKNVISETVAQKILEKLIVKPFSPKDYVKENNLGVISGNDEIRELCKKVLSENEKVVNDFKNGEQKAFQFLIGQIMRATKGKADPKTTNEIMKEQINFLFL